MAPHSSTLAWKIPWMEEPGRLQSMGSLRVGHDWATSLSLFTFHFHALEKEMATHSSVLAWRTPGTGESGGLPSMGSHRVGHDWSNLAAAALINVYVMLTKQVILNHKKSTIYWITANCTPFEGGVKYYLHLLTCLFFNQFLFFDAAKLKCFFQKTKWIEFF